MDLREEREFITITVRVADQPFAFTKAHVEEIDFENDIMRGLQWPKSLEALLFEAEKDAHNMSTPCF